MSIVQFDLKEKDPHAANSASARTDPFSGKYPSRTLEPGTRERPGGDQSSQVYDDRLQSRRWRMPQEARERRTTGASSSTIDARRRRPSDGRREPVVQSYVGSAVVRRSFEVRSQLGDVYYKRGAILSRSAGSTFPNPDHYGLAVFRSTVDLFGAPLPEALMYMHDAYGTEVHASKLPCRRCWFSPQIRLSFLLFLFCFCRP